MTRLGYDVLTASDGESALESVVRERPDLVLLDINMPGIDGFEVCRRLKADPATRLIPVVLIGAPTSRSVSRVHRWTATGRRPWK